MAKKINPRRRPATQADVERAKRQAVPDAIHLCWAILFTVLRDKFRFTNQQLAKAWQDCEKLSQEIVEGRISVADLSRVLYEEAGIQLGK